jgi:hypothetical protein
MILNERVSSKKDHLLLSTILEFVEFLKFVPTTLPYIIQKISTFPHPKKRLHCKDKKNFSQEPFLYFSNIISYCFDRISHENRMA